MKVTVFLATALAVAVTSFAASADSSDRPAPSASTAKPAAAQVAKQSVNDKPEAQRKSTGKVAKKFGKDTKQSKVRVERKKIEVDMTTTASVTKSGSGKAYGEIISRYSASYGVPVSLAHAVITIESNYRADARGSAGEIGLMQIKPATARMLGYTGSAKGLYHPETNIKYGLQYLAMAQKLGGGTTCGTILRYNAGHAAKRMNPVSAAYCSKVKRHLAG